MPAGVEWLLGHRQSAHNIPSAHPSPDARPLLIVHNKASDSVHDLLPAGERIPLMSAESLDVIFRVLGQTHRIVYFGNVLGGLPGYTTDEVEAGLVEAELPIERRAGGLSHPRIAGTARVLQRHAGMFVDFNRALKGLAAAFPSSPPGTWNYNRVQFAVHARCSKFISVAGGSAIVASYFQGTNIIMTAHSQPSFSVGGFYSRFAGTRIIAVSDDPQLQQEALAAFGDTPNH